MPTHANRESERESENQREREMPSTYPDLFMTGIMPSQRGSVTSKQPEEQ